MRVTLKGAQMWQVLTIDDDLATLTLYAKCFAMSKVSAATSAESALRLLKRMPFDAVVCDFLLPGLTGLDFVKTCVDTHPGLPIILVTGFADSHFHLTAAQKGIYALVHKPTSMMGLLAVVPTRDPSGCP